VITFKQFAYIELEQSVRAMYNYAEESKVVRMWDDYFHASETDIIYGIRRGGGVFGLGDEMYNVLVVF
jgi:hypothetical protein